eukprot:Nitzschia sp. Nitz4//scaffold356_size15932//7355//8644//NITZ4_008879-RA/size15932-processed-gene-0.5-mRNA-1//1//CDS//3329548964//3151//frame0
MTSRRLNPFELSEDDDWDEWSEDEQIHHSLIPQEYGEVPRSGTSKRHAHSHYHAQKSESPWSSLGPRQRQLVVLGLFVFTFVVATSNSNSSPQTPSSVTSNSHRIDQVVVLAERHSGISWMYNQLNECFPQAVITTSLERPGYFFQENPAAHHHNSWVFHLTQSPYDWFELMRTSPLYMPAHEDMEWEGFLATPWTMERPDRDLPMKDMAGPVCQLEYEYHRVISCVEDTEHNAIYELAPDGSPYASILDLRTAKLLNHRQTQNWPGVLGYTTGEYSQQMEWDHWVDLLTPLLDHTHWEMECTAETWTPPPKTEASKTADYVEYINEHLDWETEGEFGYTQWGPEDNKSNGAETNETDDESNNSAPTENTVEAPPTASPTLMVTEPDDNSPVWNNTALDDDNTTVLADILDDDNSTVQEDPLDDDGGNE